MYETIETKCFNDRGILLYVSLSLFLSHAYVWSSNICVLLSMMMMMMMMLPSFQKEILTQIPFSLSNSNLLLSFV
jgi:hypothetical protein